MSSVDETINNFVQCAERFNGVKEGTPQHSIILALYNSGRPPSEYEMTKNDPWCAAFVGAVASGCGLGNLIPISASCQRMQEKFPSMGGKVVTTPQKGDIVFFDWDGDGRPNEHVGIVTKVLNGVVTTIEGNKSDAVSHREFTNLPAKFWRPAWSGEVEPTEPVHWETYRDFYQELTWAEKQEIKTFPTLKIGSIGIYVKIMQDFLGLIPDGIFGQDTDTQLKLFQKEKQLEMDGVCGRQTWSSFFV